MAPTSAETARTIADIVSHGTLSTACDDGIPLGTYSSYVLDAAGLPILRLRKEAVHAANLLREPRCSLFVQPADMPARLLARVTLIGSVEPVDEETAQDAAERHSKLHGGGAELDAPQASDLYYRLNVDRCFFVAGMGAPCRAETISAQDYMTAEPDPLRTAAPLLVGHFNNARAEDVMRVGAFAVGRTIEDLAGAELLWVDRLGIYMWVRVAREEGRVIRVQFQRPVQDERDARSVLTMLAQLAWERERNYTPQMPQMPDPVSN